MRKTCRRLHSHQVHANNTFRGTLFKGHRTRVRFSIPLRVRTSLDTPRSNAIPSKSFDLSCTRLRERPIAKNMPSGFNAVTSIRTKRSVDPHSRAIASEPEIMHYASVDSILTPDEAMPRVLLFDFVSQTAERS